jgi:hypothetical protein
MSTSGNTFLTPDSNEREKSIVINLTAFKSHVLRAFKKKIVSASLSFETKAPAMGLF